jgi:hypothetical protein
MLFPPSRGGPISYLSPPLSRLVVEAPCAEQDSSIDPGARLNKFVWVILAVWHSFATVPPLQAMLYVLVVHITHLSHQFDPPEEALPRLAHSKGVRKSCTEVSLGTLHVACRRWIQRSTQTRSCVEIRVSVGRCKLIRISTGNAADLHSNEPRMSAKLCVKTRRLSSCYSSVSIAVQNGMSIATLWTRGTRT